MGCASSANVNAGHPIDQRKVTPVGAGLPGSAEKINTTTGGVDLGRGSTKSYFIRENEREVKENYIIKNKIGEGVFGVVRKVIDRTTNEEKALKVITKKNQEKDLENTLLGEINIMKILDHPSIVKMYEYYQDKKNFYIITELIKGGELFEKIIDLNSFQEQDAANVFRQLISVVQYSHEKKIMHRDLKPENILLEHSKDKNINPYSIKVVDWGSACIFSENNKEKKQVGTPLYMAPEVINKSYTNKCDLWSCGVILYIMLTGEPPFYGNDNEIIQRSVEFKYDMDQEIWKGLSEECKDLVKQLLCSEDKRLNAKQVQDHPWLKNQSSSSESNSLERKNVLSKLRKFSTKNQFHHAILTYISSQLTLKDDQAKLKQVFESLDKNNDGSLTKDEIGSGFSKYTELFNGDYDVETIFKNIDVDGNGKINYSEFITASIQIEGSTIDEHLQKTFKAFDSDGNNYLTIDELKDIFGSTSSQNNKELLKVISNIDLNGDGKISFEEFKAMMKKYSEGQ